ncbi:MAG: DUF1508 domain-containing protein [Actinomycetota bacterium]|nr:DUF1508 domain-containing protein [Actinomycetota bacterium]
MSGYFELVMAPEGSYRVRLTDGRGELMAVSVTFETKAAAVAGIAAAREIAGTGLIVDRTGVEPEPALEGRRTGAGIQPMKSSIGGPPLSRVEGP